MTKVKNFITRYKKIIIVSGLLALLIAIAVILFGGSSQSLTVNSSARSETETKLMRILSEIEGVGKAEVMVNESDGGVEGVIIVCEGANNIMTRNDVINAVKVALKIDKNNIAVYAMN
ncbi:MAG: hypothetical protein ACI4MQ_04410 [Candidatus Coproplasma sp.]